AETADARGRAVGNGSAAAIVMGSPRIAAALAFAALALVIPLTASGTAPTTPVLSGLSSPDELARDADGNLYYTEEPTVATTRLSVLRQGAPSPTPLFNSPQSFGISDVGFDAQKNAYAIALQATGGGPAAQYETRPGAENATTG